MLAITKTITKNIAVMMFPSNSEIMTSAHTVSSLVRMIERLGGKVSSNSSLTFIISALASRALAPTRNLISSVTASSPFTFANEE